ncbi:MAG: hypothetical protein ACTSQP_19835 [Promethearchaeota archaeon]
MSLVWIFENFGDNLSRIKEILEKPENHFKNDDNKKPPHSLHQYSRVNLKVIIFEKKIMIQGKGLINPSENVKNILFDLSQLNFLKLTKQSEELYNRIFPNKRIILCPECKSTNDFLELAIIDDEVIFKYNICNCKYEKIHSPLILLNNRILPDLSVMISDALVKLINLGFFRGFEIVIPNFLFEICDKELLGKRIKKIREFLESCFKLQKEGKIKITDFTENKYIQFKEITKENFNELEDSIFIELAKLTNSIFITHDKLIKDKLQLNKWPFIYIDGGLLGKLKYIINKI